MADAPSLLHPARLTVPGSLSPAGYSTTVSFPDRALSGELAFNLHRVFQKSLRSLGSEEQIAKWTPLCNEFQIIASYAQTELGHGEPGFLRAWFQRAHSPRRSQRLRSSYGNTPAGGSQGSRRRGFLFLVYANTPYELAS